MRQHLRLGHELLQAEWDEKSERWEIRTSEGSFSAQVLISATGVLSDGFIPNIVGLNEFGGQFWHSSQWRHDIALDDKRVAVVGTGASAIQFAPQIQPVAARMTVFQRTPPWIIPRNDRVYTAKEKRLFADAPAAQRLDRLRLYLQREGLAFLQVHPGLMAPLRRVALRHLNSQVSDPTLRVKLTPNYAIGCKRILVSNDWYPALTKDNVELVTDTIDRITPGGIRTAGGTEYEVDHIIFGTGFQTTTLPVADRIIGSGARTLAQRWERGMRAHRNTTVSGFPNLFLINGPNTFSGYTSVIYMIESQVNYVLAALREMRSRGAQVMEVTESAEAHYDAWLQHRALGTVWTAGGCDSWYLDAHGRNRWLWPGQSFSYRRLTRSFDVKHYRLASTLRVRSGSHP